MEDFFSSSEAEQQLRSIVVEVEADISKTDADYEKLYGSTRSRPVAFFGRVHEAQYLTISPNPSPDDIGAPTPECDLAQHCFDYFHSGIAAHRFFADWKTGLAALFPCQLSYSSNLAHVDLSPRATRSLTSTNKSKDDKRFKQMIEHDVKHLFRILAVVWPHLRGLFAAGAGTKNQYINYVLGKNGQRHGFEFQPPVKARDTRPKLYAVAHQGQSRPLFFCPVGPSALRPGEQQRFLAQFSENATLLRQVFCTIGRESNPPQKTFPSPK
jgi:hypothetical protein